MEFVCVLSVQGSLASYFLSGEKDREYTATLRNSDRKDVPERLRLTKEEDEWEVEPWHDEVAPALVHCVEGGV